KSANDEEQESRGLEAAQDQSGGKSPTHRRHDTAGFIAIPQGDENGGQAGNKKGKNGQHQRLAAVQHTHVFKALDVALFLAGLQTARTKVPAFDFAIAKRAQKATASIARHNRLLLWVVEAARLALDHYRFSI